MMLMEYVSVKDAIDLAGLRIAFTRGFPGPWSMAAKTFFDIKGIAYTPVLQEAGAPNLELKEWTGQTSAPVAMFNDERPRAHWSELLLLAERLKTEPRLIPADEKERTLMFGLGHEMCAEDGLGWTLRMLIFASLEAAGNKEPAYTGIRDKYSSPTSLDHSRLRLNRIVNMLADRLSSQMAGGSDYLVGNSLTAADIYWAAFSNMLRAMSPEMCIMPKAYEQVGQKNVGASREAAATDPDRS